MNQFDNRKALLFLQKAQAADGSFPGQLGNSIQNFQPTSSLPTLFFTALIVRSLTGLAGTDQLISKACKFLRAQQKPGGSWNYWTSTATDQTSYPDDLDDTVCALDAIISHDPSFMDGKQLGQLAKLLLAVEQKPGGPYHTWLMAAEDNDLDLGVNANIGQLLYRLDVTVPGLIDYVDGCIAANRLRSRYYVGDIPIIYFLSDWYTGSQHSRLQQITQRHLRNYQTLNSLELSMVITTGCRLGAHTDLLDLAVTRLLILAEHGHWPAAALYIDRTQAKRTLYAGSSSLTTACALEALQLHQQAGQLVQPTQPVVAVHRAQRRVKLSDPLLDTLYGNYFDELYRKDSTGQITQMGSISAEAYGIPLSPTRIRQLNQASINGWIAYTIYDDFIDEEGKPQYMSVANVAHRQALFNFQRAVPKVTFQSLMRTTFDGVDAANAWEVTHARAAKMGSKLTYTLPDYADYLRLFERSAGHMLVSCGVAMTAGYGPDSPELNSLQAFFRHFIIARQLNDDAHDWQADLDHGHLTSVVCLLLDNLAPTSIRLTSARLQRLRTVFWQVTIHQVADLIDYHIAQARRNLARSGMQQTHQFEAWLAPLANAARSARAEQHKAQQFVQTLQGKL